ncbi:MAG: fasciclin domain-containing protein [Deinococcota bacterium]
MKQIIITFIGLIALIVPQASAQTVLELAQSDARFSTLVTAIEEAGLVEALSGPGPFTIFAPTNDAFDMLPQTQLSAILASRSQLGTLLQYHVVPGLFTTDRITTDIQFFTTLEGSTLPITNAGVGDASVLEVNLQASNGVIHVIDSVLVPRSVTVGSTPAPVASTNANALSGTYVNRASRSVRYPVGSFNNSGVTGSVLLSDYGNGFTVVTIALQGTPVGGSHPAHFHAGNCGSGGDIVVPLENVNGASGFSTTVTPVPFDNIISGDHYLNIHLSDQQLDVIVACGEVGL